MVSSKVREKITSYECLIPCCVDSQCKLSHSESDGLTRVKDSKLYTCRSALFSPGSAAVDMNVIKEALSCNSSIERQYYSDAELQVYKRMRGICERACRSHVQFERRG